MGIGAAIGGVISAGASIFGASKNSKAINKASDAQAAATREATNLQRDIYNKNVGFQTPYLNTGNAAMGQINALLGLNVPQAGTAGMDGQDAYAERALSALMPHIGPIRTGKALNISDPSDRLSYLQGVLHPDERQIFSQWQQANPYSPPQTNPSQGGVPANDAQSAAEAAYDQFKNYTGYTTRLNEGLNAINGGYAANGTLQSGAALQALNKYGQDYASNEFTNYMGYLGGQQQLGPGAANALAGVGTNYANAAGNLAIQNGQNIANAAIAKANNTNALVGGLASTAGSLLGGMKF